MTTPQPLRAQRLGLEPLRDRVELAERLAGAAAHDRAQRPLAGRRLDERHESTFTWNSLSAWSVVNPSLSPIADRPALLTTTSMPWPPARRRDPTRS
ncbi:hypothetical protein [Sorangium sp. So ce693]|uniref:hypothetical protein n=1 Tax=Sorangium sp. So ce693 TaxID=3133318 RepID=UPI003F60111B